ncbi:MULTISPECIES: hypothetical protein [unclassified Sphingobacterium]|uniref:hypothetical protein n=1 Tax=unclassified Sphingobacterium TaxID=2609468 RepID=UPI0025D8CFA8|nr:MULTISPECIES: hypothetical protein [unclassified Sphingobacterium]
MALIIDDSHQYNFNSQNIQRIRIRIGSVWFHLWSDSYPRMVYLRRNIHMVTIVIAQKKNKTFAVGYLDGSNIIEATTHSYYGDALNNADLRKLAQISHGVEVEIREIEFSE